MIYFFFGSTGCLISFRLSSWKGKIVKRGNRWYDKHENLAILLENLQTLNEIKRDAIISGVMEIIKLHSPNLLERYVLDFPLDIKRRRWYDRDPYLWLLFNGLQYADGKLLTKVTNFLDKNKTQQRAASKKKVPAPSGAIVKRARLRK
jgi:hypothetical protein